MANMTRDNWEIILEAVEERGISVYRAAAKEVWARDSSRRPGGYTVREVDEFLEANPKALEELEIAVSSNLYTLEERMYRKAKTGDIKDAGKLFAQLVSAKMPEYKDNKPAVGLDMNILSELERSAETLSRKIQEKVDRYGTTHEIPA